MQWQLQHFSYLDPTVNTQSMELAQVVPDAPMEPRPPLLPLTSRQPDVRFYNVALPTTQEPQHNLFDYPSQLGRQNVDGLGDAYNLGYIDGPRVSLSLHQQCQQRYLVLQNAYDTYRQQLPTAPIPYINNSSHLPSQVYDPSYGRR